MKTTPSHVIGSTTPWIDCDGQHCEGFEGHIGDGVCDNGTTSFNFNCEEFEMDDGDCDTRRRLQITEDVGCGSLHVQLYNVPSSYGLVYNQVFYPNSTFLISDYQTYFSEDGKRYIYYCAAAKLVGNDIGPLHLLQ